MGKFKKGDKVRCINSALSCLEEGGLYTIASDGSSYLQLVEMKYRLPNHQYAGNRFEKVNPYKTGQFVRLKTGKSPMLIVAVSDNFVNTEYVSGCKKGNGWKDFLKVVPYKQEDIQDSPTNSKRFWMVVHLSDKLFKGLEYQVPKEKRPGKIHRIKREAEEEARRLARASLEGNFVVLEATSVFRKEVIEPPVIEEKL